jgi:bifunctional ADP-heptose synthase (sugar kinase/adenylyltransferase)
LIEDKVDPAPLLVHETLPTISKARVSARQQQIVRVDREKLMPLTDAELAEVEQRLRVPSRRTSTPSSSKTTAKVS